MGETEMEGMVKNYKKLYESMKSRKLRMTAEITYHILVEHVHMPQLLRKLLRG